MCISDRFVIIVFLIILISVAFMGCDDRPIESDKLALPPDNIVDFDKKCRKLGGYIEHRSGNRYKKCFNIHTNLELTVQ